MGVVQEKIEWRIAMPWPTEWQFDRFDKVVLRFRTGLAAEWYPDARQHPRARQFRPPR